MASSSPRTSTVSVSSVETAQGTHTFKITSYSLHKKVSVAKRFSSAPFAVGGHDWRIRYCYDVRSQGSFNLDAPHDSLFLELITGSKPEVSAIYKFRMVNPVTGASTSRDTIWPEVFSSGRPAHGFETFVRTDEINKYVQDDSLVIECDVTVIKEVQVKETQQIAETSGFDIQVPSSDLSHDLGRLLESEEGADLAFKVQGEIFRAHKIVLAMRSPVFKAQLFGPMSDGKGMAETTEGRTVEGMDPTTFRGLLHFIYTDSFPPLPTDEDADDQDEQEDMVKHLLVAADRYGMERMKLICESILCKSLDVGSVAYTLALAGQHHCSSLKNACIEFIVSSDGMDAVLASQGYDYLKRACPDVAVELWEKTVNKSRVMRSSSSKSTYLVPY